MDTRKLGLILLGISGFMIIIAFMISIIGVSDINEIDVEEEAIFKGIGGDITVDKYDTYSVFVTSIYSCKEVELSIYKDDWEYFFEDCDALFNEDGWNYIGFVSRQLEKYEDAERYYELGLEINPKHKGILEYQGELFLKTNRIDLARENLSKLNDMCSFNCTYRDQLAKKISAQ